eukprot:Hpha_TRINITY_DN22675_c0_g1::TRINITY_DN22675_c0_g1_i1::g.192742::m.192742
MTRKHTATFPVEYAPSGLRLFEEILCASRQLIHPLTDSVVAAQRVVVPLVELDVSAIHVNNLIVHRRKGRHNGGGGKGLSGVTPDFEPVEVRVNETLLMAVHLVARLCQENKGYEVGEKALEHKVERAEVGVGDHRRSVVLVVPLVTGLVDLGVVEHPVYCVECDVGDDARLHQPPQEPHRMKGCVFDSVPLVAGERLRKNRKRHRNTGSGFEVANRPVVREFIPRRVRPPPLLGVEKGDVFVSVVRQKMLEYNGCVRRQPSSKQIQKVVPQQVPGLKLRQQGGAERTNEPNPAILNNKTHHRIFHPRVRVPLVGVGRADEIGDRLLPRLPPKHPDGGAEDEVQHQTRHKFERTPRASEQTCQHSVRQNIPPNGRQTRRIRCGPTHHFPPPPPLVSPYFNFPKKYRN